MIRTIERDGKGLWIGNQKDAEAITEPEKWKVIHAAKEPWHRAALRYSGRSAPVDHLEYLMAYRPIHSVAPNRLILNLVDTNDPAYVATDIIDAALAFLFRNWPANETAVFCNQGHSRSATIGFLFLSSLGKLPRDFEEAEAEFRKIYPPYEPGRGMREFAKANWEKYFGQNDPAGSHPKGESEA